MLKNKICKFLCAVIFTTTIACSSNAFNAIAATEYKFDFGGGAVESGYIGVSATTAYSAARGYGFNTPANMKNVTASGSGLTSDAVQFLAYGTKSTNTFNVDLPKGLYEVEVTLGNTSRASVAAEGVFQIINMTGNCAKDKFQIPITDGQLNILVTEGKEGTAFTLSALTIKKISDNAVTNRTIYVGGDSTACNYYPIDTSEQAGWGQMLHKFIDTNEFQIRNIAASGQCARGFRDDGQFETILKYIKPGDYFLLEFGINDTAAKNNTTEAQFKEIMRDMVKQTVAKGATIILVTPQGRSTDFNSSNVHNSEGRYYRNSTLALAREENVPLVDLNVLSSKYFTSIGPNATLALFMSGDAVHPNRAGATELARLVVEDINKQGLFDSKEKEKAGDLNADGNIDAIDFALMKQFLLGVISDFPAEDDKFVADLDGDGNINALDFALMKKYLLGAITEFPVNEAATSTIYQGEDAYIYNGVKETVNGGYIGEGYCNLNNDTTSYIEWTVNVEKAGLYSLKFRYANGTTADRPMKIEVNGNTLISSLSFVSTGVWTTWQDVTINANLNAGINKIRASSIVETGGPNLDYLEVANVTAQ
jgi:lysophospholipase L1-like esterase